MKHGVRSGSFLYVVFLIILCLALSLWGAPVMAGKKPSVETCNEMGMLDVSCFICKTDEYVGMISVPAEYDPNYGDCGNRYREARQKCSQFYGTDLSETGCKWSHTMGGTTYRGWYPDYCKH